MGIDVLEEVHVGSAEYTEVRRVIEEMMHEIIDGIKSASFQGHSFIMEYNELPDAFRYFFELGLYRKLTENEIRLRLPGPPTRVFLISMGFDRFEDEKPGVLYIKAREPNAELYALANKIADTLRKASPSA